MSHHPRRRRRYYHTSRYNPYRVALVLVIILLGLLIVGLGYGLRSERSHVFYPELNPGLSEAPQAVVPPALEAPEPIELANASNPTTVGGDDVGGAPPMMTGDAYIPGQGHKRSGGERYGGLPDFAFGASEDNDYPLPPGFAMRRGGNGFVGGTLEEQSNGFLPLGLLNFGEDDDGSGSGESSIGGSEGNADDGFSSGDNVPGDSGDDGEQGGSPGDEFAGGDIGDVIGGGDVPSGPPNPGDNATVPEPATLVLMTGAAAVAAVMRRRRTR